MKRIQEIFALPTNPKIATNIDGIPLYTSDRIKERFVKAVGKSDYLKDVIPEIEKLVIEKNGIIPCWQEKSAIKLITRKILQSIKGREGGFAAFYIPDEKKIYVVLDNYINWFMGYPNEVLFRIVSHELVHYCALKNYSKFISIFKDYINDYYVIFFKDIFKISRDKKIETEVWKVLNYMITNFSEQGSIHTVSSKYKKAVEPLRKFSNLSNFDKVTEGMAQVINVALTYGGRAEDILFSGYMHILNPIYNTYEVLGVPTYGNVCYQELWRPDEVIALHVEKKILKNKFNIMIKSLT